MTDIHKDFKIVRHCEKCHIRFVTHHDRVRYCEEHRTHRDRV